MGETLSTAALDLCGGKVFGMDAWTRTGRTSLFPDHLSGAPPVVGRTFPRVAESVRESRLWVRGIVASAGNVVHAATVELLVSELTTNAVLYGQGDVFGVDFYSRFLIAVTDAGTDLILPLSGARSLGEGGRGLAIVDALAVRWGVDIRAGGKRVWFQLGGPAHAAP